MMDAYGLTKVKYPDLLAKATDAYHETLATNGNMADARNAIYDALEAERERGEAERDALNEIIGMCAAALPNGAFILPEASLDLKRKLPKEITLCIEKAYAHAPLKPGDEVLIRAEVTRIWPNGEITVFIKSATAGGKLTLIDDRDVVEKEAGKK